MTVRNISFRKVIFRRVFVVFLILVFTANSVFASSNFFADVLAMAGVRVAPPRLVVVTAGENSATITLLLRISLVARPLLLIGHSPRLSAKFSNSRLPVPTSILTSIHLSRLSVVARLLSRSFRMRRVIK